MTCAETLLKLDPAIAAHIDDSDPVYKEFLDGTVLAVRAYPTGYVYVDGDKRERVKEMRQCPRLTPPTGKHKLKDRKYAQRKKLVYRRGYKGVNTTYVKELYKVPESWYVGYRNGFMYDLRASNIVFHKTLAEHLKHKATQQQQELRDFDFDDEKREQMILADAVLDFEAKQKK